MTDQSTDSLDPPVTAPAPGDRQPKRLLAAAPSDRFGFGSGVVGEAGGGASTAASGGSLARAIGVGLVASAAGVAIHVVAATALAWTAGLLVVAATLGIAVGLAVAWGGRRALRGATRRWLAIGLSLVAVGIAIGVNWALSGMYLGAVEYVAQVYGLIVPVEAILAASGALIGAR